MAIIWEATIDNTFKCAVVHTEDYKGQLKVTDNAGKVLLDETVDLAFGASFGPDVDDVQAWENMCIEAVDKQ